MKGRLPERALALSALALAAVLLATSARGLFARPPPVPRWQSSKRPHPPRNILPAGAYEVARRPGSTDAAELSGASSPDAAGIRIQVHSPRVDVDLATPIYLCPYYNPQHQTSPPA